MNKELDFLIEDANKTEQLTAISIMAMKEPIILLFLSILSDYKRVLKENEKLKLYNNSITSELKQMTTEKFKNGWFHQSEFKGLILPKKVKDKIEHYQKLQDNYIEKYDETNEGLQAMISALQELINERK